MPVRSTLLHWDNPAHVTLAQTLASQSGLSCPNVPCSGRASVLLTIEWYAACSSGCSNRRA
ncbi:hypothetical protein P152DRAFT_459340 [Eremomyces bilateralis CBS 781.70]|uniref:Uncharacterized protein n=1 Tax=Eremomyces bilateralis CBS 781.70 TaxID=1392243 RepID=A0A6G1FZX3_9PEZI|nr:uncharacterized protein P152DRAFT_459340 [Eremomyces bilateralis CBS 781.70]KAF1811405.1 hypothetical protein P152DRAFT_459340 [Eremomyces bilateralis CBS 781.70]